MSKNVENVKEFYANDIVYRFDKNKKIVFGVVADSYNYETSSEISDNQLEKGQIRVLWHNRPNEQVWRQNKVTLLARNIVPGEIVRRLENGKETQRGYCKSTKKTFTVQIVGTDKIIEHVSCNRLHNLRPFEVDDAVCLRSKFGRVDVVDQEITMTSKCGSVVQVLTSINNDLEDFWLVKKNRPSFEGFYPGQELVCVPSSLEQPLWIKKSKAMKRNMESSQRFTVQTVKDCMVEVAWFSGSDGESLFSEIKAEEMKDLKVLEHTYDFLDTRKLLKINSSDIIIKKKDWIRRQTALYRRESPKVKSNSDNNSSAEVSKDHNSSQQNKSEISDSEDEEWCTEDDEESEPASESSSKTLLKEKFSKKHYPPRPEELLPGKGVAVEVLCMDAKATVVWQDGTEEANIPSTQLYYSISLDEHEFVPGEWVTYNEKEIFPKNKYGVVQYANYSERIAMVKWFLYNEIEKTQTELPSSEMSVYDLKKHPKFLFRPGSVVRAKPVQDYKMGKVIDSSPQGYILVKWIDGSEENCRPHDIEIIPETSDYELSDEEDTDSKGQYSWETESVESFTGGDITDETTLQNMAARLDFIRNRIIYFKEAFKKHVLQDNLLYLKDLLLVYDNSSYLDKLLGTSFFSIKSKHFQVLLTQAKERAKLAGVEFRGRLFANDNLFPSMAKIKVAEKENLQKVLKLENKVNAQMEEKKLSTETTTEPDESQISHNNLCIELLSMLKLRMDLAYAEIISKIGGVQALTIMTQASEARTEPTCRTPLPSMPVTPEDSFSSLSPPKWMSPAQSVDNEAYYVLEEAPVTHHFYSSKFEPTDQQRFLKAIQKEYSLLNESLPPGVWVRSFGNRIDLLSVIIEGPANTPYEDGLFVFDIQLSQDYPRSPPLVHYVSYSTERLNPNLYVEGKVCVSLLGTWMGKGTEVWGPDSTLLQLIVSIQGLILVSEPYYNEAGYEKQTDTQQGYENSRTYNELVILKLVQSMTEMLLSPPEVFKQIVYSHFAIKGEKLCQRLQKYCLDTDPLKPEFPLLPVSKGLKLSLTTALDSFQATLKKVLSNNIEKVEC
ncbi:uncharacterized protein LOC123316554 [Coccinella septempunctata]|uniref:uncharacterized protein LOC123316554 n=1 Tax=Coccinella septempunctata TaxID=41139 RepID=UPI001D0953F4|nr:uncharacterized protein LOC123316554 [Coccinella septempunctata]